MKIGGIDPRMVPNEEVLVLPRGDQQIVFRARGLSDMEEFNKLCPEPIPPIKRTKAGLEPDITNVNYVGTMAEWGKRRLAYIVVKSLEPSEIEWETVEIASPGSWANWEKDLKNNNITQIECNRVVSLVLEANSLNEEKIEKARANFLRGLQAEPANTSGLSIEQAISQSGELASA
jgi:hypothetical protein